LEKSRRLGEIAVIEVFVEVQAGSRDKRLYDEVTLQYRETRRVMLPYPFPYGFVLGTRCEDGGCVDCYVLTSDRLEAGMVVRCQPVGLLEQTEGQEIDHKVLATLPGQTVDLDRKLHAKLRSFIQGVFRAFPDAGVQVGRILPRERAVEYLQQHRSGSTGMK
jgi:inorganic pyrophosphatase